MKNKTKLALACLSSSLIFAPQVFADAFIYDQNSRAVIAHVKSCTYKFVDSENDVVWTVLNENGETTTFSGSGGLICDGKDVTEGNIRNPNGNPKFGNIKNMPRETRQARKPIRGLKASKPE